MHGKNFNLSLWIFHGRETLVLKVSFYNVNFVEAKIYLQYLTASLQNFYTSILINFMTMSDFHDQYEP